jgi:transcriptional regulator with XRE-family HTH domain
MKTDFNKNLYKIRTESGTSRKDMALALNTTENIVRYWETEALTIQPETLIKIADYFETTIDMLVKPRQKMIVSSNIAVLRNRRGITQSALAADLEISRTRVATWEEHRAEPNIEMLCRLANYFEVSVDDLIKKHL